MLDEIEDIKLRHVVSATVGIFVIALLVVWLFHH